MTPEEIARLKTEYDAAKKLVIDASKRIFELEKRMDTLEPQIPALSLFMPAKSPADPKEQHQIQIIADGATQGHKHLLEFAIDTSSLEGSSLKNWLDDVESGHLFSRTHKLVMSNGNIYEDCWPIKTETDEIQTVVQISYSGIQ